MKITKPTKLSDIKRDWHFFDVKDTILGRVAVEISAALIGKGKPYYAPNMDCGDHAVVVNAKEVKVTGKKFKQKIYSHYSGYPSGLKQKSFETVLKENPTRIIREAVYGMLPKNKLRDRMLKRLHVFADDKHTFQNKLKE